MSAICDLYPAIDLRGGRVVRLRQGDYDAETVYGDDPVAVAAAFADAGAPWVHVVDLDAARSGDPVNRRVVERIAERARRAGEAPERRRCPLGRRRSPTRRRRRRSCRDGFGGGTDTGAGR